MYAFDIITFLSDIKMFSETLNECLVTFVCVSLHLPFHFLYCPGNLRGVSGRELHCESFYICPLYCPIHLGQTFSDQLVYGGNHYITFN